MRRLVSLPFARTGPLRDELEAALPRRPFALRFWDGSSVEATEAGAPTLTFTAPGALAHVLRAPGELGLGRAYVAGLIEVDDIDAALEWWSRWFAYELRGRVPGMAFIDLGDQFVALSEGRTQPPDGDRHVGLVVEDKEALRRELRDAGIAVPPDGRHLRVRDPSGNQLEIVDYRDVQFTKTAEALRALGVEGLEKSERARAELASKGLI